MKIRAALPTVYKYSLEQTGKASEEEVKTEDEDPSSLANSFQLLRTSWRNWKAFYSSTPNSK